MKCGAGKRVVYCMEGHPLEVVWEAGEASGSTRLTMTCETPGCHHCRKTMKAFRRAVLEVAEAEGVPVADRSVPSEGSER
jgi:hypothetical protein